MLNLSIINIKINFFFVESSRDTVTLNIINEFS